MDFVFSLFSVENWVLEVSSRGYARLMNEAPGEDLTQKTPEQTRWKFSTLICPFLSCRWSCRPPNGSCRCCATQRNLLLLWNSAMRNSVNSELLKEMQ